MEEEDLQRIYTWVDEVPLSRPKRNIARDFADGVLVAEIVGHYYPKLIDLHNYSAANSLVQKLYNWNTMNQKVLKRLGMTMSKEEIEAVCNCSPGAIEQVLKQLQYKLANYGNKSRGPSGRSSPTGPSSGAPKSIASAPAASRQPLTDRNRFVPDSPGHDSAYRDQYSSGGPVRGRDSRDNYGEVDTDLLVDKEQTIAELRETVEILEAKIKKLEQLVRLKDTKIETLQAKLSKVGIH
mmetsp:Transcript_22849/g.37609  ORF Transcript_22849/g.37609 Transcript_22849/m.37609 type:complete len:238 (-) Transcript_22849:650-1363(-)